jgi:thioester reductase-like protein
MHRYGRPLHSDYSPRIHVVPLTTSAGIGATRFGLSESDFLKLSRSCGSVYHLAADTNFNAPYSVSRTTNVLSAVEVLRFATAHHTVRARTGSAIVVHHISTLSVFGRFSRPDSRLREDTDLWGGGASKSPVLGGDGYSATKWVAEQIMNRAK